MSGAQLSDAQVAIIQSKRFKQELALIEKNKLHYITAYQDDKNKLIWYFLIKGQKDTDYNGGEYIGKIEHDKQYPFKPPSYYMLTPSGRLEINKKICLTNSSFHPETWNAQWDIIKILNGFYSSFETDVISGVSFIVKSKKERSEIALKSENYNKQNLNDIYSKFDKTYLSCEPPAIKKEKLIENIEIMSNLNLKNIISTSRAGIVIETTPKLVEQICENKSLKNFLNSEQPKMAEQQKNVEQPKMAEQKIEQPKMAEQKIEQPKMAEQITNLEKLKLDEQNEKLEQEKKPRKYTKKNTKNTDVANNDIVVNDNAVDTNITKTKKTSKKKTNVDENINVFAETIDNTQKQINTEIVDTNATENTTEIKKTRKYTKKTDVKN